MSLSSSLHGTPIRPPNPPGFPLPLLYDLAATTGSSSSSSPRHFLPLVSLRSTSFHRLSALDVRASCFWPVDEYLIPFLPLHVPLILFYCLGLHFGNMNLSLRFFCREQNLDLLHACFYFPSNYYPGFFIQIRAFYSLLLSACTCFQADSGSRMQTDTNGQVQYGFLPG